MEADPQPLTRSTVRGRDEQSQVQCSSRLIYQGLKFMIFFFFIFSFSLISWAMMQLGDKRTCVL